MKNGDTGSAIATLQRQLIDAGLKLTADGWYGDATEAAVSAFQRRAGLVVDGIAGPKTLAALQTRDRNPKHLSERDLEQAAALLDVELAAIKAVNAVESAGNGFLPDGRPVILYERHVAYRLLEEAGLAPETLGDRYGNLINPARGGYAGGPAEWSRLATARQIIPLEIADAACSWGAFQIMGFHWERLGYASIEAFTASMASGEAAQLDAFVAFIKTDPALLKALKGRKWADFAKLYNGPAYRENLYDLKLARAYDRFKPPAEAAA